MHGSERLLSLSSETMPAPSQPLTSRKTHDVIFRPFVSHRIASHPCSKPGRSEFARGIARLRGCASQG